MKQTSAYRKLRKTTAGFLHIPQPEGHCQICVSAHYPKLTPKASVCTDCMRDLLKRERLSACKFLADRLPDMVSKEAKRTKAWKSITAIIESLMKSYE